MNIHCLERISHSDNCFKAQHQGFYGLAYGKVSIMFLGGNFFPVFLGKSIFFRISSLKKKTIKKLRKQERVILFPYGIS
jgi:hypothetical protein